MIEKNMVRSVLIPAIIEHICKYYDITPKEAMKRFYESNTCSLLEDESTGLYGQSPLCLAGMFIEEQDGEGNLDISRL